MRILIANPNTSDSVTQRIVQAACAAASPGTEIVSVTASQGVPYIVTRAEAAVAAVSTLELLANHGAGCDAAIVAAFGDPGLEAARELMPIPVVGLAEASILTACALGRRFSLVAFAEDFRPWYHDAVERAGLLSRLASIRCVGAAFRDIATVQDEKKADLRSLCAAAASEDGADVVILAGAPLAGLAADLEGAVPVPVLDGVSAAVRQAEALAGLFRHPLPKKRPADAGIKRVTGVSESLRRLFEGRGFAQ